MRNNLNIEALKLTYENLGKRMHELHNSLEAVERKVDVSQRSAAIFEISRSINDCITARAGIEYLINPNETESVELNATKTEACNIGGVEVNEKGVINTIKATTATEKRIKQHEAQEIFISESTPGVKCANDVKIPDGISLFYIGENKYRLELDSSRFLSASDFLNEVGERRREIKIALNDIRDAIQNAEEFGLVRDEAGNVITGAVMTEYGIMLTKE